ncbi:MAG: hypothetical protein GWN00_06010 [Aliifodinibius sp.]|nr:hypothetical protein [Fodinibius sp.]NIY24373.1 hypothetical protein [Fodinibius sp.]
MATMRIDDKVFLYHQEMYLGQIVKDSPYRDSIAAGEQFDAHYHFKGRNLYLMIRA